MPQEILANDQSLTNDKDCQLLQSTGKDNIGAGMVVSSTFPCYSLVYNYECYGGTGVYQSWCPIEEAVVGRLMAYAAAVRWEAELPED